MGVTSTPPEVTSDSSSATKTDMKINVLSKGQQTDRNFRETLEASSSKLPWAREGSSSNTERLQPLPALETPLSLAQGPKTKKASPLL